MSLIRRTSIAAGLAAFALVAGLGFARPVAAQQHTNQARGFNADGAYQVGDIDNVNLFNGNLTVDIPIGQQYATNDGFSYQLRLVYNSNLWNFREVCPSNVNFNYSSFYTRHTTVHAFGNRWLIYGQFHLLPPSLDDLPPEFRGGRGDDPNACSAYAYPNPSSNAGMGWQVSLGNLLPPRAENWDDTRPNVNESGLWMYVSPNGSEHLFHHSLHVEEGGGQNGPPDPDTLWTYTRDGSYLRMTLQADGTRDIEFPNGEIHTFEESGPEVWRLRRIGDRFDNALTITYGSGGWTLTDSTGRTHFVDFVTLAGGSTPVIDRIRVAKFGGGWAEYDFTYQGNASETIERACPSSPQGGPGTVSAHFLESVTFPDGQRYRMLGYDKSGSQSSCDVRGILTKLETPAGGTIEWKYRKPVEEQPFFDDLRGFINGYVYPQGSSPRAYVRASTGVRERRVFDPVRNRTEVWSYDPHLQCPDDRGDSLGECFDFGVGSNNEPPPEPEEFVNVVTRPDQTKSVHFFSVYPIGVKDSADPESMVSWEYGLPFTKRFRDVVGSRPPVYLSTEVFATGVDPFPPRPAAGEPLPPRPAPLRAEYVRYEYDTPPFNIASYQEFYDAVDSGFGEVTRVNRRELARRTVYFDQGVRAGHRDVWNSNFDGYGHYRTRTIEGDVAGVGNTPRTTTVNYNAGRGTYPAPNYVPITVAVPWLPNLYSFVEESQPGSTTFRTNYCFDSSTGYLHGTRRLANAANANNARDVLTRFEREVTVLVEEEETGVRDTRVTERELYYGGDGPGSSNTPAGCDGATSATAEYRIDRTFRYGGIETEQWIHDASGDVEIVAQNHQLDPSTGLVVRETAADGLATSYVYDALGRLTRTTPDNDLAAVTLHQYTLLGSPEARQGARIDTCRLPARSTALCDSPTAITKGFALVDGFGRMAEKQRRYPGDCQSGSCWAQQLEDEFPIVDGRRRELSSWRDVTDTNPTQVTKSFFDPLGRLTEVREPRGGGWKTIYEHNGGTTLREANLVFLHDPTKPEGGSIETSSRWTVGDLAGRTVKVTEASDETSNLQAITRYEYDAADRLTKVSIHQAAANGEAGPLLQERRFCYDGRGFLVAEKHPEIGENGNGAVHYTYDSLGRMLSRLVSSTPPANLCFVAGPAYTPAFQNLRFAYDRVGRLIEVRGVPEPDGGATELALAERFYARNNSTASRFGRRSAGKLVQAKNYNPEAAGWISESWVYDQPHTGEVSTKHVRMTDAFGTLSFSQSFTFDPLGNLASETYPQPSCPPGTSCAGAPAARTVTRGYQDGYLVRVSTAVGSQPLDVASDITYHPNALWSEVTRKNFGTTAGSLVTTFERQRNDSQGLPRPSSIEHQAAGGHVWTTGPIVYDTAGNIFQMGSDRFAYDGAGRLQWARQTIDEGCTTAPCTYEVEYDYDIPGNLSAVRQKEEGVPISRPFTTASTATNRLVGPNTDYDREGNLTLWDNRLAFAYDPQARVAAIGGQGVARRMLYNADGERIVIQDLQLEPQRGVQIWRLRGLENQVLREVRRQPDGSWSWQRDYLYRDRQPLAQITPNAANEVLSHLYGDHLGTPRHTSGAGGHLLSYREYLPFGEEITRPRHEQDFLQFTGHERDFHCLTVNGACAEGSFQAKVDDLDYMHARYYSPWLARFLSVDPQPGTVALPQTWNRYAYTANNPIAATDPDGQVLFKVVKTAAKVIIKGGDFAGAVAGIVEDVNTLRDPNASTGQKALAVFSLATEIFSPVSLKEGKAGARALGVLDDAKDLNKANKIDNANDARRFHDPYTAGSIAEGHAWRDHRQHFPEAKNPRDLQRIVQRTMDKGEVKKLDEYRTAYYDRGTNTLVVKDVNHTDGGTAFRPDRGADYFDSMPAWNP
jgi:RHS repeat-associated protein